MVAAVLTGGSVSCAVSVLVALVKVTVVEQLPAGWKVGGPAAVVPSNRGTVVPAVPPSASVTVPVTVWAAWLAGKTVVEGKRTGLGGRRIMKKTRWPVHAPHGSALLGAASWGDAPFRCGAVTTRSDDF